MTGVISCRSLSPGTLYVQLTNKKMEMLMTRDIGELTQGNQHVCHVGGACHLPVP